MLLFILFIPSAFHYLFAKTGGGSPCPGHSHGDTDGDKAPRDRTPHRQLPLCSLHGDEAAILCNPCPAASRSYLGPRHPGAQPGSPFAVFLLRLPPTAVFLPPCPWLPGSLGAPWAARAAAFFVRPLGQRGVRGWAAPCVILYIADTTAIIFSVHDRFSFSARFCIGQAAVRGEPTARSITCNAIQGYKRDFCHYQLCLGLFVHSEVGGWAAGALCTSSKGSGGTCSASFANGAAPQ